MASLAIAFAGLSVFGSAAQAASWPWEATENAIGTIMNVCGPNNVPSAHQRTGDSTATVVPQFGGSAATGGDGLTRLGNALRQAHVGSPGTVQDGTALVAGVKDHGLNRYGYGTLEWDAYGSTCFVGPGQMLTGPANALYAIFVKGPAILLTAVLDFAMSNVFYDMFSGWVGPFMQMFAKVLGPWVLMIVLLGGTVTILVQSKGSLSRILRMGLWMMAVLGLFFSLQTDGVGNEIKRVTNNVVTQASNLIACQVVTNDPTALNAVKNQNGTSCGFTSNTTLGTTTDSVIGDDYKITGGIEQAIWYAIPYQVWSQGAVGPDQYNIDHARDQKGELSWSAAILNAKHVNPDDALGQEVRTYSNLWNQAGYQSAGKDGGQKMRIWTDPDDKGWKDVEGQPDKKAWDTVPYLGVVKALCNDVADGSAKSEDLSQNLWAFQGNCDAAGANVEFMPSFKGDYFWERGAAVVSGSLAIGAASLPIMLVALYLAVQKMLGYFILLFAPIFLAIGAFPDEKRMGFAKRYGELFIGNLLKQVVAVCVVLFVITGVSGVLSSPSVVWYLKPMGIIMFTAGLIFFAIPLASILKAAAKGDVSIVDKTLTAPQRAAKTAAKVAGVVAIAGATMGVGAFAAGGMAAGSAASGAAGAAKGAGMLGRGAAAAAKGAASATGKGAAAKATATATGKAMASNKLSSFIKGSGGLRGAAQGFTKMVSNGDALRLVRHTGLTEMPVVGDALRKGLGLGQVGMKLFSGGTKMDPAVERGLAQAREDGVKLLDQHDQASATPQYHRDEKGNLTEQGRQQAMADYDKMYAGDPEGDAAERTRKDALNEMRKNHFKATGEHLPESVTPAQSAENIAGSMSTSAWSTQVITTPVKTGEEILTSVGGQQALLSPDSAAESVTKLFQSYEGMANMDPTHVATPHLVRLGFAAASQDAEFMEAASLAAQAAISEHGVPDRIAGFTASPEFAAAFTPAAILETMPVLTSASTMAERAEAAGLFTVASMTVGEGAEYQGAVNAYRAALMDPQSVIADINELKSALANTIKDVDASAWQQASAGFVASSDGTTGFNIGGDSTLNWSDAKPAMALAAAPTTFVGGSDSAPSAQPQPATQSAPSPAPSEPAAWQPTPAAAAPSEPAAQEQAVARQAAPVQQADAPQAAPPAAQAAAVVPATAPNPFSSQEGRDEFLAEIDTRLEAQQKTIIEAIGTGSEDTVEAVQRAEDDRRFEHRKGRRRSSGLFNPGETDERDGQ